MAEIPANELEARRKVDETFTPENVAMVTSSVDVSKLPAHVQYELAQRTPIADEQVTQQEDPFAGYGPSEGPAARENYSSMLAILTSPEGDVESVMNAYSTAVRTTTNAQAAAQQAAMREYERERQAVASVSADMVYQAQSSGEVEEVADSAMMARADVDARASSEISTELKVAEKVAPAEAGEYDTAFAAVDMKIYNDITQIMEDNGTLGLVYDIGKMFLLPGKEAEDLSGLTGMDLFGGREELMQAVVAFDSITNPAEKLMVWEALKREVLEETSPTQAANILSVFATGQVAGALQEYTPLSVGVSGADALLVSAGAFTRLARSIGTTARINSRLGNIRSAAKMAARALAEETDEAARAAGTAGRVDAADMAEPVKISGLTDNDVNLLGPEIQRQLQANAAKLNADKAQLLDVSVTAPLKGELTAVQQSLQRQVMARLRRTDVDVVGAEVMPVNETTVKLRVKVLPKSQKADNAADLGEATAAAADNFKEPLARATRRTADEKNTVDEVDFELQRIKSRKLDDVKTQKQVHALLNRTKIRRNLANIILTRMRANPDIWKSVVGDMSRGRWERAASRMAQLDKKLLPKQWASINEHPVLQKELAGLLQDNWKQSKGKAPRKPRVRVLTEEISAQIDDYTGTLQQTELPMAHVLLSNRAVARSDATVEQFDKAAALDNISAGVYDRLHKSVKRILDEVGSDASWKTRLYKNWQGKRRIEKALIDGDEYIDPSTGKELGKVWTPEELRTKFELDDNEVAAYYKIRQLFEHLHVIRNAAARRELVALGYKDIKFKRKVKYVDADGKDQVWQPNEIGRPYTDLREAYETAERSGVAEVFDSITGESVALSRDMLRLAYEKGQRLVRLHQPIKHPVSGKRIQHVLADGASEVRELPMQVLTRKAGYVPRVYTRGVWFVRAASRNATVDGRVSDTPVRQKTLGMADNRAAAERLREQLAADGDGSVDFVVDAADQMDPADILSASPQGGGRLYTGSRGDEAIPFYELKGDDLVEARAERASAFDALQGNISNISFHLPRNEWRVAMLSRLQKTAKQLRVEWNGLHAPVGTGAGGDRARQFMERQRQQARDWLAMPDDWQTTWDSKVQYLYERALGSKLFSPAAPALWWIKSRDPVTALRAATFHLMLGMLNPVQTFVQAQGFAVAASMNIADPAELVRVAKMQSALQAVYHIDDIDTLRRAGKIMAERGLVSAEDAADFAEMAIAFKKSGLREGVLTNADFSAMESGFGQVARGISEKLSDKGLWFYRQGELFTRRFAFVTAYRQWKKANPDRFGVVVDGDVDPRSVTSDFRALTQRDLEEVVSKTNSLMLNLGRANRAAWQKGVLSVPTQFWQVQAKLLEDYVQAMLGSPAAQFSRKEIMKLFAGQIALYGAAGVPVFGAVGSYYLDYNDTGIASSPDSTLNRTFDEGLYGMVFAMLGADVEVSKRGAILSDLQDLFYDIALGDKSMAEAWLGAASSTLGRVSDGVARLQPLYMAAYDPDQPVTKQDFLVAMDVVGDLSTSWSNATKAYIMATQDKLFSRSGQLLDGGEWSPTTILFTAMGFSPRDESASYDLRTLDRMYAQNKSDAKKDVRRMMLDYVTASEAIGGVDDRMANRMRAFMQVRLNFLREDDRLALWQEIQEELRSGKTEFAKATNRFININNEAILDSALSIYEKSVIGQQRISEEDIE